MNVLYSRKILGSALVACAMLLAIGTGTAQWMNRNTRDSVSTQPPPDQTIADGTTGSFPTRTAGGRVERTPPGVSTPDAEDQTQRVGSSEPTATSSCDPARTDAGNLPSQPLPDTALSAGFGAQDWRTPARCSDGGSAPSMIAGRSAMFSSGGIPPVGILLPAEPAGAQLSATVSSVPPTSTPTPEPPVVNPVPPAPPVSGPTTPSPTPPSPTPPSTTPPPSAPPSPAPPSTTPPSAPSGPSPVILAPPSGSSGSASGSGGSGSGSSGSGGAPPTDPFHGHEDPAPDPFSGPSLGPAAGGPASPSVGDGGSLGLGGGGEAPPSGGGVSETPEPGSVLLIGTGLAGILGILRRRRLI